jgi:hypothetical protein
MSKTAAQATRQIHRMRHSESKWQDWVSPPMGEYRDPQEKTRPSHDQIERLAYALWEQRGRPDGSPEQDWHRAEQALMQQPPGQSRD